MAGGARRGAGRKFIPEVNPNGKHEPAMAPPEALSEEAKRIWVDYERILREPIAEVHAIGVGSLSGCWSCSGSLGAASSAFGIASGSIGSTAAAPAR